MKNKDIIKMLNSIISEIKDYEKECNENLRAMYLKNIIMIIEKHRDNCFT